MINIIPAIDIISGRCVRLTRGDYNSKREYSAKPLEIAKAYEDAGCQYLHLVDLDGAKSSHIVNYHTLELIASHTNLIIDFGGGLKSDDDLRIAFECGAWKITGGSVAIKSPTTMQNWLSTYGSEKIVLGADSRDGMIATNGWTEGSTQRVIPFIKEWTDRGITQTISTDINCDGTLSGPSLSLYSDILNEIPQLYLIASGGVGSMDDIYALDRINVPAVIVGKALYEGKITLKDLELFNTNRGC